MRFLVLNGPNLNMTGRREPKIYGSQSMDEIMSGLKKAAEAFGVSVEQTQTNHEGTLIDLIQQAPGRFDAILINAGALTHYSYALRDAIACCPIPVGEVHMSDIEKREPFRAVDVIEEVCAFRVMGLGGTSYERAAVLMAEKLKAEAKARD
ncbi:MAG: 3-dehydroquinate dehydratase [Clostridia bacterium]|nr:3-dehydroquinate dehydratase [Clostridia bacterium]